MSRIKADLSRVSLNQLCTLTGKTSRTLKKLLSDIEPEEESGTLYYDPVEALPVVYGASGGLNLAERLGDDNGFIDPVREKARLDRARADKVELELQVMKGKLIPVERVEATWSKIAGAFRAKILNLPKKVATRVCATKDIREIEKILAGECAEALTELSHYGDELDRARAHTQSS